MTRQRLRGYLLIGGVLPLVLVLCFAVLVGRMLVLQQSADRAYAEGRQPAAIDRYHSAGRYLPFESWIALFDVGTSHHAAGEYPAAISAYEAALRAGVPKQHECEVRTDLALAHEATGDAAGQQKKYDDADKSYRAGIKVLEDTDCDQRSKDAKTVDIRLHQKLERNQQQKQKQQHKKKPDKKQQQQQDKQKREQKKREQKLQQQNQQGAKERKKEQQDQEGFGYQPAW
ncbi:hypothetical protein [Nocardioides montaniterrae]